MYTIGLSDTYAWPVHVQHPKDGGGFEERTFDAIFKRFDQPKIDDINARAMSDAMKDLDVARIALAGWKGVKSDGDVDYPFSETNRDVLLTIQGMPKAIVRAWYDSLRGGKEKN
jgi:hypothetical protein